MKKIRCAAAYSLLIVLAILLTHKFWLRSIAKSLIVNDKLQASDVVIVPSGNDENLRIDYAVKLYKLRFAPKILLCGRLALQKETGVNLGKIYAGSLGVEENDILLEEESSSTLENALFSLPIVEKQGFKSAILVTYPVHTKRAKTVFRKIFPRNIRLIASCDLRDFNTDEWWKNTEQVRSVVYEYFSFIWYFLFKK